MKNFMAQNVIFCLPEGYSNLEEFPIWHLF